VGAPSKIDRLIEMGLSRYGAGDLEGALIMWEEALAMDPDNKQAASYADYVRLHVELLGSDPEVAHEADVAPFAIEEEPEYQIEVTAGELSRAQSQPARTVDNLDAGWFEEESATRDVESGEPVERARDFEPEEGFELELELEAEPALEHEAEPALGLEAEPPPAQEVSFEPATREYFGTPTAPTAGAELPPDFADLGTEGGTREYGGARPTGNDSGGRDFSGVGANDSGGHDFSAAGTDGGTREFLGGGGNRSEFGRDEYTGGFTSEGTPYGFSNQETEVRKRDFGFVQPVGAAVPVGDSPPERDATSQTDAGQTTERPSFRHATAHGTRAPEPDEEELLATLPNPRRQHIADLPTQDIPVLPTQDIPVLKTGKAITKDMPDAERRPAQRDSSELSQGEVTFTQVRTQVYQPAGIDIGAPTRDLGLRPIPPPKPEQPDDEEPVTKQSDVRALRDAATRGDGAAVQPDPEPTQTEHALPFDAIAAHEGEILEAVDADAPPDEPREDQTRRRVAALLERAVHWNTTGETEKAITAVDLAMNEDPNSALGQKLITRNRDTIMSVFQGYLGDLERMPQLARPLHELADAPISPRAAFLLSRIDGSLTIDELLDVSGMPRLEAFRHLCQLYLRGILR
jgi:hypothetical protein